MPEEDRRRWHINRGIDLGHLLLSLAMLAGFFVWAVNQDRRLTTVELGVQQEHATNVAQDQERNRQQDQTRADLRAINEKLDRLLEGRR
jgi:TolA-binding protein